MKTLSLEDVTPLSVSEPPPWVTNEQRTDDDFEDAIEPLYIRGCIQQRNARDRKLGIEKRPVLSELFRFTLFDAALWFSRDVVDLASAEKVSVMVVVVTV